MFCLRSWLPLLFIPTNASPAFIFLFFVCTYFLNRPCVYCSVLLLILFVTSCYWSDRCFFDFSSNWFAPRPPSSSAVSPNPSLSTCNGNATVTALSDPALDDAYAFNATAVEMLNSTATALAGAAAEELARKKEEWTGLGIEWLRSLLGKREWRIECMDLYIRL
ncbi:bladder cancer-related protein BC10-domain-containing protein [Xylariomycetidae sp. FL0641]|nr:bladder cancer-related protein BC10-domain-containing protein [Xylariomycetidae sp. FL0641]